MIFVAMSRWLGSASWNTRAFRDDRVVTSLDQRDEARRQRRILFAGGVRGMAGAAQQTRQLARPDFLLDLDQRLKFAQVTRVA